MPVAATTVSSRAQCCADPCDNPAKREQTDAENQPIAPRTAEWTGATAAKSAYFAASVSRQYFSGIENVLRIERVFQRVHGVDRLDPEFGLEILLLALPDAVLAGAGPAHRLRALHQAMHEVLAARHLLTVVHVAHQRAVEIAVANVADNRRQQIEALQIRFRFGHAISQPGNRHAHIGRHHARAGTQALDRPIGVVPRLPELGAVLRSCGP